MAVDVSNAASAIEVPVVVGDRDKVETEEVLRREMPRFVHNVRFHILDNVGHLAPLETPEEVASIIAGALRGA